MNILVITAIVDDNPCDNCGYGDVMMVLFLNLQRF